MADTVATVHATARAILADTGETYDDDVLFPFTKIAHRKAARALRGAGMGLFQKQSSAITVTAAVTAISRSSAPTYPSDLLRPIRLREKPTGSTYYQRMNSSDGFLPDQAASTTGLAIWDWRNDTILVPACTINVDVQILYEAELAALTGPSSLIVIPDGIDPMAKMVASMVARSRDEKETAKEWWDEAMEDLAQIAAAEAAAKQARSVEWGS